MPKRLTIVVGGYIVAYPMGGMTWHHLNYLLGLAELGHEVWFLEDSGSWYVPFNPTKTLCEIDPAFGLQYLKDQFAAFGLPPRFCYYSQFLDQHFGLSGPELNDLLKRADLLLCVSGVTPIRPTRPRPRRMAVIDTDPVFTQIKMQTDAPLLEYYRQFDSVATFGRLIGTADCPLPTHGLNWIPTNQPVALPHWPAAPITGSKFATIGKWEQGGDRAVEFDGKNYSSSKSTQWMKLLELPSRTSRKLMLAMQSMPADARQRFTAAGWELASAESASRDCRAFRDFVQASAGELSAVKPIYAGVPSGWFSDRSACYLATGRPVVMQRTGFERWLPTGKGLFAFDDLDQAAAALAKIDTDPPAHAAAARDIAQRFFDSQKVLSDLLAAVM
jgi:hypothetical protein